MSNQLDLAAIKAAAEAATPGPWYEAYPGVVFPEKSRGVVRVTFAYAKGVEDTAYITLMHPQTTLALVAEVERLRAIVEAPDASA